jgi:hypothetical protein
MRRPGCHVHPLAWIKPNPTLFNLDPLFSPLKSTGSSFPQVPAHPKNRQFSSENPWVRPPRRVSTFSQVPSAILPVSVIEKVAAHPKKFTGGT